SSFKKVRYSEVYPGIDVDYHGNGRRLEYDFLVKPRSNPAKIRLGFSGVRRISVDSTGDLVLQTDGDPIVQKKPRVYQLVDGHEEIVEASYLLHGHDVGFKIGPYDVDKPLIIDPVLEYSTFWGGTGTEFAFSIAVDGQGAAYVTGSTTST